MEKFNFNSYGYNVVYPQWRYEYMRMDRMYKFILHEEIFYSVDLFSVDFGGVGGCLNYVLANWLKFWVNLGFLEI